MHCLPMSLKKDARLIWVKRGDPLVKLRGHRLKFTNNVVFLSQKTDFVLENSEGPDEMAYSVAFQLGLHCLQSTHLWVSILQRVSGL